MQNEEKDDMTFSIIFFHQVLESLDCYGKAFETLKKIRTLVWKPHLGFANLDLQIGDKHLNVTVSPAQAAIINLFQDKTEWTANELVSFN